MVIIHTNSSIMSCLLCVFELFIRAWPLVALYQYLAHPSNVHSLVSPPSPPMEVCLCGVRSHRVHV
jgi:hypothetical protein